MRSKKLSKEEIELLCNHAEAKGEDCRALLKDHKIPPPYDTIFERAQALPFFPIVLGAWIRAMHACGPSEKSKFTLLPSGQSYIRRIWKADGTCSITTHRHFYRLERDRFLYLYRLKGDTGLGNGNAEAGRQLRLAVMEAAREAGDSKFVKAIENLRDRKKPDRDADKYGLETRKLILGTWLPFSLWAMDDKSALNLICSIRKDSNAGPDLDTWRQQRYQMDLVTFREIHYKCALLVFSDGKLRPPENREMVSILFAETRYP
jgi:hypothetical protein